MFLQRMLSDRMGDQSNHQRRTAEKLWDLARYVEHLPDDDDRVQRLGSAPGLPIPDASHVNVSLDDWLSEYADHCDASRTT